MKYFLLGAFSSAFFLMGSALLYGYAGTLTFRGIAPQIGAATGMDMLLISGVVLILAGLLFKVGAVPFHSWTPDTYQGAPTPITGYMAAGTKIAAFAAMLRFLYLIGSGIQWELTPVLWTIIVLTMLVGTVVGLVQTDIKRLLAYSSISHVGFLLLGLAGGEARGYAASLFYGISYALMSAAAFGAIVVLSRQGFEADRIDDFKGLNARNPWQALLVMFVMASLAGVPPFLGFWAKLAVLRAALEGDLLWLAIVGIVFAVIGAFYYLRVIKVMYFDAPSAEPVETRPGMPLRAVFAVNALALLGLGLFWSPIMAWCQQAFA